MQQQKVEKMEFPPRRPEAMFGEVHMDVKKSLVRWYYAVHVGRHASVYTTWDECEKEVRGYGGAQYRKLRSRQGAEDFFRKKDLVAVVKSDKSRTLSAGLYRSNLVLLSAFVSRSASWSVDDLKSTCIVPSSIFCRVK